MKILILGLGSIGQRHVRNIRNLLGNSVEIICYRKRKDNHTIIENHSTTPIDPSDSYNIQEYSSLKEAYDQTPDILFVTNPTSKHINSTLQGLKNNCHVFIEKPLGDSLENIEAIINKVKEKKLIAMLGYQMRFHPAFKLLISLINENKLGNLMSASFCFGEYLPNAHPYEDYQRTYSAKKEQGGGVVFSYCHEIDMIYKLFGIPSKILAYGSQKSNLKVDVIDNANILIYYEKYTLPINVQLDYVSFPPRRNCTLIGSLGYFYWDMITNKVTVEFNNNKKAIHHDFSSLDRNKLFELEISYFFDCIKQRKIKESTIYDGANNMIILNAINESISNGSIVQINSQFS